MLLEDMRFRPVWSLVNWKDCKYTEDPGDLYMAAGEVASLRLRGWELRPHEVDDQQAGLAFTVADVKCHGLLLNEDGSLHDSSLSRVRAAHIAAADIELPPPRSFVDADYTLVGTCEACEPLPPQAHGARRSPRLVPPAPSFRPAWILRSKPRTAEVVLYFPDENEYEGLHGGLRFINDVLTADDGQIIPTRKFVVATVPDGPVPSRASTGAAGAILHGSTTSGAAKRRRARGWALQNQGYFSLHNGTSFVGPAAPDAPPHRRWRAFEARLRARLSGSPWVSGRAARTRRKRTRLPEAPPVSIDPVWLLRRNRKILFEALTTLHDPVSRQEEPVAKRT